jgi:TetR/AcrR family transcriptional repressor of nem operon
MKNPKADKTANGTTKEKALRESMSLLQASGYNGFSFQHVADALGIKKPSLYDHFESKEELGLRLINDYRARFTAWQETIAAFDPADRLAAYFEAIFRFACDGKKLCPIGALGSDFNTLPKRLQKELSKVFAEQVQWLELIITDGQRKKIFRRDLPARELAELVVSAGLGSQKTARISGDEERVRSVKTSLLKLLK